MKLPKQFIEEITPFETIYCLVSGGYHSTTSALLLKDHEFENVILVHNKTYLESKHEKETIEKIRNLTSYKYIETEPNLEKGETVWDILKRSLQKIPEVKEDIKNKRYDRSKFECCRKLKKEPSKRFYQMLKNPDSQQKNNFVVVNSIAPYESNQRRWHLHELRKNHTYLRLHKTYGNIWHIYPMRDCHPKKKKELVIKKYLESKGIKAKHTGCIICPILICFKIYNKNYYNTLKAMARAGLPCFQKTIMDFTDKK